MVSFLTIKVKPSSKTQEIIFEEDGTLLIRLKNPPSKGKANKELLNLLKSALGTTKVTLVAGQTSSTKRVEIDLSPEELDLALKKIHSN